MGVFGRSSIEINATAGGAGSGTGSYDSANQQVTFFGTSPGFPPGQFGKVTPYWISQTQSPGPEPNAPFSNYTITSHDIETFGLFRQNYGGVNNFPGIPYQSSFLQDASLPGHAALYYFNHAAPIEGQNFDFTGLGFNAFLTGPYGSRLTPVNANGADSLIYFPASVEHANNFFMKFNSLHVSPIVSITDVKMDNPVLDALFQGLAEPWFKTYWNGFIAPLLTHGSGPTRNAYEIAVFSADLSKYWLINFIPMDAESALQLSRGVLPQVAIDTDGIFWLNSGNAADLTKLIYSFSTGFNFPILYFGNLQPISLPCWIGSLPGVLYSQNKSATI